MTLNINAKIAEVTRLTRAGRLAEAVAFLRGRGQRVNSSEADRKPMKTVLSGAQPIDSIPARSNSDHGTAAGFDVKRGLEIPATGGVALQHVPEAMRGFIERLPKLNSGYGLHLDQDVQVPLPDGARFEECAYANGSGNRTYKLFIPSSYCKEPLPLIVMLHGCKQSPDDFAAGTRMNELAQEQGFLVAYPRQPPSANPSKCWNWFNAGDQQRGIGEPSLIAGITRQIMQEFTVDPARVYIAGLSAGGAAAAIMGSTYPDLFAAICVHSGLACGAAKDLSSAFSAMRQGGSFFVETPSSPLPTIVFHGDCDNVVNALNGDQVIAQSKAGAEFQLSIARSLSAGGVGFTRTIQTDVSGHAVLEQWVLHGAGHAWSGGSLAGTFTDPRGPDASREMVRFFLEHPRRRRE